MTLLKTQSHPGRRDHKLIYSSKMIAKNYLQWLNIFLQLLKNKGACRKS